MLASRRLPQVLLSALGFSAHAVLLLLPAALAVRLLIHRQPRRLAEAVLAGGITVGVVVARQLRAEAPGRRGPARRAHPGRG